MYSHTARASSFLSLKTTALIFMCWVLPWKPCSPAHLTAGGYYFWSSTGKCGLKLSSVLARATKGWVWGQPSTQTRIPFHWLSFCDSKALSQGRMSSWGQQHHCSSYWSSAKRVLLYRYYWWCCYYYYCYCCCIPHLICPKEIKLVLLYTAAILSPLTNITCQKCWRYSRRYDASF